MIKGIRGHEVDHWFEGNFDEPLVYQNGVTLQPNDDYVIKDDEIILLVPTRPEDKFTVASARKTAVDRLREAIEKGGHNDDE